MRLRKRLVVASAVVATALRTVAPGHAAEPDGAGATMRAATALAGRAAAARTGLGSGRVSDAARRLAAFWAPVPPATNAGGVASSRMRRLPSRSRSATCATPSD